MRSPAYLLFLLTTVGLHAAPIVGGAVQSLEPPQDLRFIGLASNSRIYLIPERLDYTLLAPVTVEVLSPGVTYRNGIAFPGINEAIATGTLVDIYLLHIHRSGLPGLLSGSVDFGRPILGFALRGACLPNLVCLDATDTLGHPGNTYPAIDVFRGLDLVPLSGDSLTMTSAQALSIASQTSALTMDELRVFVVSAPEPGTWLMLVLPLFLLAWRRIYGVRP